MLNFRCYFRLSKASPMLVFMAFNLFYYSLIAQNKSDSLAESIKIETDLQKKAQMLDELANEIKTNLNARSWAFTSPTARSASPLA